VAWFLRRGAGQRVRRTVKGTADSSQKRTRVSKPSSVRDDEKSCTDVCVIGRERPIYCGHRSRQHTGMTKIEPQVSRSLLFGFFGGVLFRNTPTKETCDNDQWHLAN
jgi:hypothetical protein